MIGLAVFIVALTGALIGEAHHPSDWWIALWVFGFICAILGAGADA